MEKIVAFVLSLFSCTVIIYSASVMAEPSVIRRVLPALWRVEARIAGDNGLGRQGSGIMIAPQKILTNCHVIQGSNEIFVTNAATQKSFRATRAVYDTQDDLCLLVVPHTGSHTVKIDRSWMPQLGDPVLSVGYPLGNLSYGKGKVTRVYTDNGVSVVDTSAGCNFGNSGGALLNARGELVGINTFMHISEEIENGKMIARRVMGDCNAIVGYRIGMLLFETPMRLQTASGREFFEGDH